MSCAQNYEAVIFDLWGTLVDSYPRRAKEMAGLLGVDQDNFASAWSVTLKERMVGTLLSTEAVLARLCRELGVEPEQSRVRDAVQFQACIRTQSIDKSPSRLAGNAGCVKGVWLHDWSHHKLR